MGIETLAIAGLAGSAISGVTGFIGAQQSAGASAAASSYQAQVARNNQIIAENNAQYAAQSGAVRGQTQDFKNAAVEGRIAAEQGASGIDFDSPSSAAVRSSTKQLGRYDTETLYNNALLNVYGAQSQATGFGAQAGLDEFQARNAKSAGLIQGLGSLLSGASSFASKWAKFSDAGAF
jgi:hypothetical protein